MNKKLIEQLNQYHKSDEHSKIIETIENLPKSELNFELKSLLGRAYNNEDEYNKALAVFLSEDSTGQNNALWNFRVGYAYFYKGDKEIALSYFEKSFELGDTSAKGFIDMCKPKKLENQIPKSKKTINNISWSFSSQIYLDSEEFNQAIIEYQIKIYKKDESWIPSEVVFENSELQVQYEAWITKPSDLLENEILSDDDSNTFEKYPNEEHYQVEIIAKLKANNGKNFTALEFLMKIHNQQANKELGDHVFFEGTDENPENINGVPTYYIACGS